MLSRPEAAVIRAALSFWIDEIEPHGSGTAEHYLDEPVGKLPNREAIERLRDRFKWDELRVVEVDRSTMNPVGPIRLADQRDTSTATTSELPTWTVIVDDEGGVKRRPAGR